MHQPFGIQDPHGLPIGRSRDLELLASLDLIFEQVAWLVAPRHNAHTQISGNYTMQTQGFALRALVIPLFGTRFLFGFGWHRYLFT
jgi:hypothetical protein